MIRRFRLIFLLFSTSLMLLFFVSCGPAVSAVTETPTPGATFEGTFEIPATSSPTFIGTVPCEGLCPEDSMTATAAMAMTFAAIPSSTPPPWATIIPAPGDLGWGSIHGHIFDGASGLPIEGATVTCAHLSDTSPYLCDGVTTTDGDGMYAFTDVFFRETDHVTLLVEAPGYLPLRYDVRQALIPPADFQTDLGLFPLTDGTFTPTPYLIMCTPPPCSDGVLVCGEPGGCLAGCGAICLPATPTP